MTIEQFDKTGFGAGMQCVYNGVYDNFMEYETARMKGLHSGRPSDIPNIN